MNKCSGCGAIIESDKILCERCFRIRNYNEYTKVELNNSAYIDILKKECALCRLSSSSSSCFPFQRTSIHT